ncbi:MAG TPA: hypothetical protein DDW50_04085 [Firmicutes bacterium]|nr:hypothetical protein [Bacillota bacterium]
MFFRWIGSEALAEKDFELIMVLKVYWLDLVIGKSHGKINATVEYAYATIKYAYRRVEYAYATIQ